jgi:hypothetical protein
LATSAQGANSFRMTAMFSDQAGLVQYIQLRNCRVSTVNIASRALRCGSHRARVS